MAYLIWRKLWRIAGLVLPIIYIISDSRKFVLLCSLFAFLPFY